MLIRGIEKRQLHFDVTIVSPLNGNILTEVGATVGIHAKRPLNDSHMHSSEVGGSLGDGNTDIQDTAWGAETDNINLLIALSARELLS